MPPQVTAVITTHATELRPCRAAAAQAIVAASEVLTYDDQVQATATADASRYSA